MRCASKQREWQTIKAMLNLPHKVPPQKYVGSYTKLGMLMRTSHSTFFKFDSSTLKEFNKVLEVPSVLIVVINNAVIGLVTSVFLRSLNSILKTFASALDPVLTAVLCWVSD